MKRFSPIPTIVAAAVITAYIFIWYKLYRAVPEPPLPSAEAEFRYGPGIERSLEIPYWMWLVMPRIFPDLLPGPGGYRALGIAWEFGQELPIGFSKRTAGYPRVSTNCALCHTASYRASDSENPHFSVLKRGHTSNLDAYFRFLTAAAADERFNAKAFLAEMDYVYDLSLIDKLLYRYWIIPSTKRELEGMRGKTISFHPKGSTDWQKLETSLKGMPLPKYPFAIDDAKAARGQTVYGQHCAACHDRSQSPRLDGIWARAPFLSNGSVPDLRELLKPESGRTGAFYRGYDVYDPQAVGFISQGPQAEREGILVKESSPGHAYGVDLGPTEKEALIEYLKKL